MRGLLLGALLLFPRFAFAGGFDLAVGAELAYDDNVFLLTEKQKGNVDGTGKYDGMVAPGDLILSVRAPMDLSTKAVGKRTTFRIEPGASLHFVNTKRSYFSLEAALEQKLWKDGEAFVRGGVAPSRFKKNYAVAAGYEAGVETETFGSGGLKTKLGDSAALRAEVGVKQESWNAPFDNRNENDLFVGAGLGFDAGKKLHFGVDYEFIGSQAPGGTEPTGTAVDRSYMSHEFAPAARLELSKKIDLVGDFAYRRRQYTTTDGADPYQGRVDQRIGIGAGVRVAAGDLKLKAGWDLTVNGTNRPNAANPTAGDELDYVKNVFSVGATYAF